MRVALVTDRLRPALTHDDRRLVPAFADVGVEAVPAIWDDPSVAWGRFGGVIVRSTWDYHRNIDAFMGWVAARSGDRPPLINPAAILRWNANKSYLDELGKRGAPVVPTERVVGGTDGLRPLVDRWSTVVVKPAVSAAGKDTWRVDARSVDAVEAILCDRIAEEFLVQPYVGAIETSGELSLVFFGGSYSHAVRKRAPSGGFLIHEEHGGTIRRAFPSDHTVDAASSILSKVDGDWVYARVDLVEDGDRVWLIELEMLEPELFVRFDNAAPKRFVDAVMARLRG